MAPISSVIRSRTSKGAVSNVATVTITIISVNDPPVAVNDVIFTLQGQPQDGNVIENDYDVDGFINPQSVVITLNPKSGTVRVNGDGTITFLPSPTFLGNDTFRYTVRDNEGATSNQAVVTINVVDENLPPIAVDDDAQTIPGEPVTINVVANDIDTDGTIVPGSVTVVQDPADGTVVNNLDGTVTYTPDPGYSGVDVFTYTVRDDFNEVSNVAAVRVTVAFIGPPWQNPENPLDVDGDGFVVPLDALLIINEINDGGSRPLGPPPTDEPPYEPPPYLDVNGDDFLSPLDALMVINELNAPQPVPAVAAPVTAAVTWSETHVIGAALDIEPRFQPSSTTRTAVDQLFVDTEASRAQDLSSASPVSSSWTTDPPQPKPGDVELDAKELLDDGLLEFVAQGIHDLPEGEH